MKLSKILSTVGGAALKTLVPGSGIIIDLVNGFLDNDKKLTGAATGTEISKAIGGLPQDKRVELLSKELDVEITEIKEWSNVFNSMTQADGIGNTTRPKIAHEMSQVVCFSIIIIVSGLCYSIVTKDTKTLKEITDLWPLILAILGTPTALLRAYFGMRTKEKHARYNMANGQPTQNLLTNIVGLFKK